MSISHNKSQADHGSVATGNPSDGMNAGLCCRNVTFAWDGSGEHEIPVLEDVSLTVRPGEIVSIIGPTGCGKSTLLRILMGLTITSHGEVLIDGDLISEPTTRMGIIFQEHGLFPWLTVQENVEFGLRMRHVDRADSRSRGKEVLQKVGLAKDGERYPHELSGGMKRRVAIARLLANDAEYLLMDEPFEALDYQTRLKLQEFLVSVHQKFAKTILLVTHQVDEAILLSDRILLMSAHPGRFARELRIDLKRPRDLTSEGVNQYRAVIIDHLEQEVTRLFSPD